MVPSSIIFWASMAAVSSCDAARGHYEALSFDAALAALATADRLGSGVAADCLEVKGLVLLALDRRSEAEHAFGDLFDARPEYAVDVRALAPADLAFIERIRQARRPLSVDIEVGWLVHAALRLEIRLQGGLRGASHVRYRATVASAVAVGVAPLFGRVATTTISVPSALVAAPVSSAKGPSPADRLHVRLRVVTPDGETVARFAVDRGLGDRPPPDRSLFNPLPVASDESLIAKVPWWVWTLGALVVVAGVVTTVVVVQPDDPDAGGTLGRIRVP